MTGRRGGSAVREVEFAIYKRLSERWEELTKPLEGAELLTVWLDELDRRLNVDVSLPKRLDSGERRREALAMAWRVLCAALEAAGEEGVEEIEALAFRLHAPVCGSVPEEAGIFDASPEKLRQLGPEPQGDPEGLFERIWWHPFSIPPWSDCDTVKV